MPPSAFTSPAVTAASRCCSASVRRTRFAASLRPGGRPSGFLSDSLPPTFCFFFRASSFSYCSHAANQADSGKKAAKAPLAAPGEGWGTGCASGQPSPPPGPQTRAGGCQRERTRPKGAYAEHTRARRELRTSVSYSQCKAMHSLQMCISYT